MFNEKLTIYYINNVAHWQHSELDLKFMQQSGRHWLQIYWLYRSSVRLSWTLDNTELVEIPQQSSTVSDLQYICNHFLIKAQIMSVDFTLTILLANRRFVFVFLFILQVELDRPVKEHPQSSLTATLLARMAEEGTEELVDHVPAPSQPESSEVALELAKHDISGMAETRAEALSEVRLAGPKNLEHRTTLCS